MYIDIIISRLSASSTCSSFMRVMHFVNGAQYLNTTLVLASPPVAVTRILLCLLLQEYMRLNNHKDLT